MESAQEFIKRRKENFQQTLKKYQATKKDNCLRWFPDINRKGKYGFLREAWTFMPQHNLQEKIFIVERFKRMKIVRPVSHENLKVGEVEYRIGYYMIGKNGNKRGKWTWGESCAIIPKEDFDVLIAKAKKEKTIL